MMELADKDGKKGTNSLHVQECREKKYNKDRNRRFKKTQKQIVISELKIN